MDNQKILVPVLIGGGLAAFFLLSKKTSAEGMVKARVQLAAYSVEGTPISSLPYVFEEGKTYTIGATIQNMSTKNGEPVGVTFHCGLSAATTMGQLFPAYFANLDFGPGETREISQTFTVPVGWGGHIGGAGAGVETLDGQAVAQDTAQITMVAGSILYAASVNLH